MTRTALAVVLMSLAVSSGCRETLEVEYGVARGKSINGTSVFRQMLQSDGHQVDAWPFMSSRVENGYDVLILFHDGFGELPYLTLESMRVALSTPRLQSLVIVPRDSDAAVQYLEHLLTTQLSEESREEVERAHQVFRADLAPGTSRPISPISGVWYGLEVIDREAAPEELSVTVREEGETDQTVAARWPLRRRLVPVENYDVIWQAGDDPLLAARQVGDATVYVTASACPLLNGGLVDPGNRILAEDLVERLGEPCRVALVTSTEWMETSSENVSLWSILRVQPYPWIFAHLLAVILLFCWWKFPIFGRPQSEIVHETKRFGKHVEALGDLLQRTGKPGFSVRLIHEWQQSQKSHRSTLKES